MKQFTFFSLILTVVILFSCKKESTPDPTPVTPKDTLTAGWKRIPFIYSNEALSDIFFIGNTGFCISGDNVFKSTDGGTTWNKSSLPYTLSNLGMGSDQNIIFAGPTNQVIITHDGGVTFKTVIVPDGFLTDVFFVNTSTAFLAGKGIWKTTDAGDTWTKIFDFSVADGYKSLHFINDQTGWVVRKDGLYKTINGGIDWQLLNTGNGLTFNTSSNVFFPDVNHGFVSDHVSVAASDNTGTSWTKIYTGSSTYHDIHFTSSTIGYITDQSLILKTTDGGLTWNKVVILPGGLIIELHFIDADHGWACGPGGVILKYEK